MTRVRCVPLFVLSILAASHHAAAQFTELRIHEVLPDPVGPNAGHQLVEIEAVANRAVDLTGFQLSIDGNLVALPSATLSAGRSILLFLGASGSSTNGIHLPQAPTLGASGVVAIFRSNQVQDPNALVDFVSWGGGAAHIDTAVAAGRWSSRFDSLPGGIPEGSTYAHRDAAASGRVGPDAFYVDSTPTLGAENDPGMTWAARAGCDPIASPGILLGVNSSIDPGPWIAERHRIFVQNTRPVPLTIAMAIGFQNIGIVPLDGIGLTGCTIESSFDIVQPLGTAVQNGLLTLDYVVGNDPTLVGVRYWMQAIGAGAAGLNPLGVDLSRSVELLIGSR